MDLSHSEPIVFFGNERLATGVSTSAPTLRSLIKAGFNVVAVVSHNESTASRKERPLEIAAVAAEFGVPVLLPVKPADIISELKAIKPVLGVLVAYGKIVPRSIIDIFPRGIVNVHPSLLPLHRGPIPVESVILDGSVKTGVSLMQLAVKMDAGPVYAQTAVELHGNENKQTLADNLSEVGAGMVAHLLSEILSGAVIALPQDDTRATYDALITKADGVLDWNKTAVQLEREVRAYAGWPGSRTTLAGKDVIITKAHALVMNAELRVASGGTGIPFKHENQLCIATSNGVLVIDSLKPAGKANMSAQAFLAGYGKNL